MIITISGKAGSGKSTLAKLLVERLHLKHYSVGDMTRQLAKEHGMSLIEFAKYEEEHPEVDKRLDDMQRELGKKEDDFIIDGRLSFHFIPGSIKLFLDVSDRVGAERIFKDRRKEENGTTIDDLVKLLRRRRKSEKKRWMALYGKDPYDKKNYDIVINTSGLTVEEAYNKVLKKIKPKHL